MDSLGLTSNVKGSMIAILGDVLMSEFKTISWKVYEVCTDVQLSAQHLFLGGVPSA